MKEYTDDSLMPWGKHKGKKMVDVPRWYLKFIFKEMWGSTKPMGEESNAVQRYILDNGIHKS